MFDLHCAKFGTKWLFSHSFTEMAKFLCALCVVCSVLSQKESHDMHHSPKFCQKMEDIVHGRRADKQTSIVLLRFHSGGQKVLDLWSWEQALLIFVLPYCVGHSQWEQSGTAEDKEKLQVSTLLPRNQGCLTVWICCIFLPILLSRFHIDSSPSLLSQPHYFLYFYSHPVFHPFIIPFKANDKKNKKMTYQSYSTVCPLFRKRK